jgi:hypothetical protein
VNSVERLRGFFALGDIHLYKIRELDELKTGGESLVIGGEQGKKGWAMGRHSASCTAAKYAGRAGALALAMGVGAAVAGGAGTANADGSTGNGAGHGARADSATHGSSGVKTRKRQANTSAGPGSPPRLFSTIPHQSATPKAGKRPYASAASPAETTNPVPHLADPVAAVVAGFASALGLSSSANTGGVPVAPMQVAIGALQLIRREIEGIFPPPVPLPAAFTSAQAYASANPAIASEIPTPADEAQTAYGDIGKWMLQPNGQISNYGGQSYDGKTLLETVNVIIVDPTSTTPAEATCKLNAAMFWSGFPAQLIHSSGFSGNIDGATYGQQPGGILLGYSDNFFLFPDDHGRMFGPAPVETSTGYVWSGSFSSETLGFSGLPGHIYVSSDLARTALAMRLIASGQATFVGMVPLDNAYNTATTTTGDHDGYAVVLQLK